MEVIKTVFKFMLDYFSSVKEDIFGANNENEDEDWFDVEADPTEGTRLMRPESVDITEQEISSPDLKHARTKTDTGGVQHQMHRPTMQVTF